MKGTKNMAKEVKEDEDKEYKKDEEELHLFIKQERQLARLEWIIVGLVFFGMIFAAIYFS